MNMRAFNGLLQRLLIVALIVGLLSACGGKEERKAKHLEKGKSYLAEKNYDKAKIELKNVLQIDPKDANGYLFPGQIEEKQQNWAEAFGAYKKASELDPELIETRVRMAKFYLAQAPH
jgi:cytochrome c-type biogenesis protein CcmH/NrfG